MWLLSAGQYVAAECRGGAQTQTDSFGPFGGWTTLGVSVAPDNNTHVLWDNDDGRMTTWMLDGNGRRLENVPVYGPY